jgi:hypothetical protein
VRGWRFPWFPPSAHSPKASLGGSIVMAPITYQIDGKQYLSVTSEHTLVTFALRD